MRKLLTILAFACLLFLTGGYHLLYQVRLVEIRSAVKNDLALLQKKELTPLAFSTDEAVKLDWEDEGEFRYQNKMYDVVKMERKNGRTIYWCLSDEKETALAEAYFKTQKQSSDKDPSHSLFKLLKTPFLPVSFPEKNRATDKDRSPFPPYSFCLFLADTFVVTPPPKVC